MCFFGRLTLTRESEASKHEERDNTKTWLRLIPITLKNIHTYFGVVREEEEEKEHNLREEW